MSGAASSLPTIPTMPHMLSALLRLLGALAFAEFFRPARLFRLLGAGYRERILGDCFRDDTARADIGAVLDLHRRHQRGVRSDENAGADIGVVFVEAVVIAGNRARPNVRAGAHPRIAEIGEMIGFG